MEDQQKTVTLPIKEARTLLVELMHESFDTVCSKEENGQMTITWPASVNIGKQLDGEIK